MSAVADGIQINQVSLRDAVAARLNPQAEPPATLQTPVESVPVPETTAPVTTAPVEQVDPTAIQTDPPVQAAPVEDEFELDLNKNPLDDAPPVEQPILEPPASRKQWEAGFQDFIKTNPRGQKIWDNHVEMAKLSSPAEEGGIGFRPDAEQVKDWHRSHAVMDRMMMDFTSGDPAALKNFVDFWLAKDAQGRTLEGVDQFAERLPSMLAEANPEAYQKIGTHYGSAIIDQLSSMASSGRFPEADAARLADAAVVLGHITGIKPAASGQPAQLAQPNSELEAAKARIRELEGHHVQQNGDQIRAQVTRSLDTVLARDAETALAPLKETYKDDPLVFDALKAKMISEIRQVAMSNSAIRNEISNAMTRMVRSGTVDQLDGVVRLWRKAYADRVPETRSRYLKAAGVALTSKANESRTILQQASEKTAPNAGAAPGQSTSTPDRQPGEKTEDFIRRVITARNAR